MLPGPQAGQAGPCLRPGCAPACGMPRTLVSRSGQWPDDPASGAVTWPVAVAPRIGRNAGRWLQSQSESGGPDHGPKGVHGRRAEPGPCHGLIMALITVSAASRQVPALHEQHIYRRSRFDVAGRLNHPLNPAAV